MAKKRPVSSKRALARNARKRRDQAKLREVGRRHERRTSPAPGAQKPAIARMLKLAARPTAVNLELGAVPFMLPAGQVARKTIDLGSGKCSSFGGPSDKGMKTKEGLALIEVPDIKEWWFRQLFLPDDKWNKKFGLGRNLDPNAHYA